MLAIHPRSVHTLTAKALMAHWIWPGTFGNGSAISTTRPITADRRPPILQALIPEKLVRCAVARGTTSLRAFAPLIVSDSSRMSRTTTSVFDVRFQLLQAVLNDRTNHPQSLSHFSPPRQRCHGHGLSRHRHQDRAGSRPQGHLQ